LILSKHFTINSLRQKKYVDIIEPFAIHKAQHSFKYSLNIMLQSAEGIEQVIGDEYCKAIISLVRKEFT
jgi:hypothetical protein